MSLSNTELRYGTLTKIFHWLTALLILTAFPLGIVANNMAHAPTIDVAATARIFSLHKTLGVAAFFVALLRILWALTQRKPPEIHPNRKLETFLAHTVHWSLYAAMLVVPLSGWIYHAASSGYAPILWPFAQNLPLIPKSEAVSTYASAVHGVFTKVLLASIFLHVAGAIKHAIIDRDGTLARMWFGARDITTAPARRHGFAPLLAALVIYAVGFGVAITLANSAPTASPPQQATRIDLSTADSGNWQVREGQLAISTMQFGSAVEGSFANWSAEILFDENAPKDAEMGQVAVEIDITSLALGSTTKQALGTDYLNAAQFPTARFSAPITAQGQGYRANGTLELAGVTAPVDLAFSLDIDGDVAKMTGQATVDRRVFQIGDETTDPDSLGFEVPVTIELTAERR